MGKVLEISKEKKDREVHQESRNPCFLSQDIEIEDVCEQKFRDGISSIWSGKQIPSFFGSSALRKTQDLPKLMSLSESDDACHPLSCCVAVLLSSLRNDIPLRESRMPSMYGYIASMISAGSSQRNNAREFAMGRNSRDSEFPVIFPC